MEVSKHMRFQNELLRRMICRSTTIVLEHNIQSMTYSRQYMACEGLRREVDFSAGPVIVEHCRREKSWLQQRSVLALLPGDCYIYPA